MKTNEEFFDSISSFYDKMINFDAAIERRKKALSSFVEDWMRTAADLGSGTGLDSISLSLLGLEVTGFDISRSMIEHAELNAGVYKTNIEFIQSAVNEIPSEYYGKFDLLVSLGNTTANIHRNEIAASAAVIYKLLNKRGKAIIQVLNIDNQKLKEDRIVNITSNENSFFVRFYDFLEEEINFNILKFDKDNPDRRTLNSTKLYRYSPAELKKIFSSQPFAEINLYSSFNLERFIPESSKDVILVAEK